MKDVEQRLGLWAEDPRSLAGARALEGASRERQTVPGRLDSLVGRRREMGQDSVSTEMTAGVEQQVK